MRNIHVIAIAALLPLALSACSAALPPAPTPVSSSQPAPAAPPVPTGGSVLAEATLSGRVYEVIPGSPTRTAGIEGVAVYCEPCGESTHNYAYTDAQGEYVFPRGVWTEGRPTFPVRIWIGKDGYQDPPGLAKPTPPNPVGPGWREVVMTGDTRFDIELVRR